MIRKISNEQKKIAEAGFTALKKNGVMVYSTCTVEPEENELVVSWLLDKFPNAKIEPIKLDIKKTEPILEFNGMKIRRECKDCLRVLPQDNNSMGFFVTKIRKE